MRILMTTDTVGGVWTFTTTLTEQLLKRGHEICLISLGREPSAAQEHAFDHVPSDGRLTTLFTGIPLEWMQNNEDAFTQGQEEILDDADCFRPDLIVSNQFCFGRLDSHIPRIVIAHSDVLSWAQACKPEALEPSPWLYQYMSIVQSGLLDAAAVVTPTTWMGKALSERFSLPHNYTVIPNGAAVEAPPFPPPNRKWQAITAGRLWDQAKGLDTLRGLHLHMPLLVAGDNTFESPDPGASWPGNLTSLGPLSPAALHAYFRESDIYLCPSRYEPFGLAPLEAALCGCAVVARNIHSLREVWSDGALYYDDNASLVAILQALGYDFQLLSQAANRSRDRASMYTPERMTESYLDLFHSVLRKHEATPHVA